MRMSLKDLDPNILLILIGSLFVLIGASGKIFIEKFSLPWRRPAHEPSSSS